MSTHSGIETTTGIFFQASGAHGSILLSVDICVKHLAADGGVAITSCVGAKATRTQGGVVTCLDILTGAGAICKQGRITCCYQVTTVSIADQGLTAQGGIMSAGGIKIKRVAAGGGVVLAVGILVEGFVTGGGVP